MNMGGSLLQKFLIIIFVFGFLILGGIQVGSLNLRNILSLLFFFYALINFRKIKIDQIIILYFLFLLILILCNVVNNEIGTKSFVRYIFGDHFSCIATILAMPCLLRNMKDYQWFIKCLIVVFIINGVVSILQYHNNPIGWAIATFLVPANSGIVDSATDYIAIHNIDNSFGFSLAAGLMGFVVTNGYFCGCFHPLITGKIFDQTCGFKTKYIYYFLLAFSLLTIFVIQQRMAMLCIIIYIFYYLWNKIPHSLMIIIGLIVVFMILLINFDTSIESMGRFSLDKDNSDRFVLFQDFNVFLERGDVLFGGCEAYYKYGHEQHNAFLDTWVRGGLITLFFMVMLFLMSILKLLKGVSWGMKYNYIVLASSISCLFFHLYSQTHSVGIQSGSVMFWIPYEFFLFATRNKQMFLNQNNYVHKTL